MSGPRPDDRATWNIVSVTGHRAITRGDAALVIQTMAELVRDPMIDAIYFGGAGGTDNLALRAALRLRTGKRPHLVVVVPNRVANQPHATWENTTMADEVIEMHLPITASDGFKAYAIRDQYLVDVASSVVAFYNPARRKSGTGMTVSLAEKRAIPVRIVRVKSV